VSALDMFPEKNDVDNHNIDNYGSNDNNNSYNIGSSEHNNDSNLIHDISHSILPQHFYMPPMNKSILGWHLISDRRKINYIKKAVIAKAKKEGVYRV
jgi:hypothetical protein